MRLARLPPVVAAAVSAALIGLAEPAAHAQSDADRATARSLGGDGQQALDHKDYKTAEDRFRRADSLVHAPTLMLGLARALAGLGRYVEAQETYNRIVREGVAPGGSEVFKRALADAKKEVDAVGPKVGGVTISVHAVGGGDVPTAKVLLDGSAVSTASLGVRRAIDPGSHTLQVSADGFRPAELHFDVTAGGSVDQPVALEVDRSAPPVAPPEASPALGTSPGAESGGASSSSGHGHSALPWVAFGVGAVGLGVGAVTGFMAMDKHSTLANECSGTACNTSNPAVSSDLDSFHTLATISTVGFIAGGVGVAAGVILLLTQPKGESAGSAPTASAAPPAAPQAWLSVVPVVGLGSIGAVGTF